jgi:hypothetical protein
MSLLDLIGYGKQDMYIFDYPQDGSYRVYMEARRKILKNKINVLYITKNYVWYYDNNINKIIYLYI